MRLFAKIFSVVFHPLLMLTYGMILALFGSYLAIYPLKMKLLLVSGVFAMTALLPGVFIYLMVRYGKEIDFAMKNRKVRTLPYLLYISSIIICAIFLLRMMLPFWLIVVFFAASALMVITMCINFFWKISAHMIGIGGLLGAIMGYFKMYQLNPWILFVVLFLLAGMLGTSRLILGRHSPAQVYAGFLLGFIGIYLSTILSYFFLFI